MTDEEFEKQMQVINENIEACRCELEHAKEAKREFASKFAKELTERYKEFIGKRVTTSAHGTWRPKDLIGFFGGFDIDNTFGGLVIYPIVYKEKKDGTASKNKFVPYDSGSYDKDFKIVCSGEK